jgi:hypothetical protein
MLASMGGWGAIWAIKKPPWGRTTGGLRIHF